jgi:putative transcriptional regulator
VRPPGQLHDPHMLDWRFPGWPTAPSSPLWSPLRTARFRAGLSQAELAAAVGTTRQTISALERGRTNPSPTLARDLATELGVAVKQLFTTDELK